MTAVGLITNTGYHVDDKKLIFDVWGRDENGDRFHLEIRDTRPYFFTEDKPENLPSHFNISHKDETIDGNLLWRIETAYPSEVSKFCNKFEPHYEADILYKNRVRYDNGWKTYVRFNKRKYMNSKDVIAVPTPEKEISPRVNIIDIETDDSEGFPKPKDPFGAVVSIAIHDSFNDKYLIILNGDYNREIDGNWEKYLYDHLEGTDLEGKTYDTKIITVGNEKELYEKFNKYLQAVSPDIISGWNVNRYDVEYLEARAGKMKFNFNFSPYAVFDTMKGDDGMATKTIRNKLDIRGKQLLGVGKLPRTEINLMWRNNPAMLIAYNLLDVILVKEIDDKRRIINNYLNFANLAGIDISQSGQVSWLTDAYILHRIGGKVRLLSKNFVHKIERYEGGHVEKAVTGLLQHIGVLDFKSEYPSLMMEFNISPEMLRNGATSDFDKYYKSPNGNYYLKHSVGMGLVPEILKGLLELRNDVKKDMVKAKSRGDMEEYQRLKDVQNSIKIFMNGFYGQLGSKYFRLSSMDSAGDITAFARDHIKWIYNVIQNLGYKIVYSDTDSVFVVLHGETYEERLEEMKSLKEKVNATFDEFVQQYGKDKCEYLHVDIDKIFESWIQCGTKKRYAGLHEWKDIDMRERPYDERIEIKGFEWRRIDQSKLSKEVQYQTIRYVLEGEDISIIREYLRDIYKRVRNGELAWDIGTNAKCGKSLKDYNSDGGFVGAFKWMLEHGYDVDEGTPFLWWWNIGDIPKGVPYDAEEIHPEITIDYERMLERNVENKVKPFLEEMVKGDFSMQSFLEGMEATTFGDFME